MARILFGVQGDSAGHVNRARIVAQELGEHEFLFVGGGTVQELGADGYSVMPVPVLGTLYRGGAVDLLATVRHALETLVKRRRVIRRVGEVIDHFDPHLILTDYEYFTATAARTVGRTSVSLDHQHVITHCIDHKSDGQHASRWMTKAAMRLLFSKPEYYLVVSFFRLPPANPANTEVLPAIVNRSVRGLQPREGEHVLVYQTSPTFHQLLPLLETMDTPVVIYGLGEHAPRRKLVFRPRSKGPFLEDSASCRYVIANGGHNVISEALCLGKPIFSFPIANAYEQFMNARFLSELGYGGHATTAEAAEAILAEFHARLDEFRASIKKTFTPGNDALRRRLNELIHQRRSVARRAP